MSDRRIQPDPAAESDSSVSRAYRKIATERTPEHLDRSVLDAAARAARPRYYQWRMWTRPAAWAAVVMLSVTLIMQTNQFPLEMDAAPAARAPAIEADRLDELESEVRDADRQAVESVAERKAEAPVRKSDLGATRERSPDEASELRVTDDSLLRRAEEMSRLQQGENDQPQPAAVMFENMVPPAADSVATFSTGESGTEPLCDDTVTAEPETWLECILELEEAGLVDTANLERQRLSEAFPDFDSR